jgi:cytochrome c biogenesis protein CcdA/thiol-disulfide isomerase/thioredoxin
VVALLVVGFLAGLITALSPCVLPVLPLLFAGGAAGGRRRPYAIVAGIVASFTFFTLAASWLLDLLGLPQDFLRNLAIAALFLVAATLVSARVARALERPLLFLTRRRFGEEGGGFLLGVSLGLVFVPCAGPVLAAVSVLAATREVDAEGVLLTLAYACGAATPMLAVAVGGRSVTQRLRPRLAVLRPALGVVVGLTALAIAFGADARFQRQIPGYTEALQNRVERSDVAARELARVVGAPRLSDRGRAPELRGISRFINTPGERPLTLRGLRGRVIVVDFWTYSCVNCLRTLPYLRAWDETYREDGLTVVGVHTPEFAFEREEENVEAAVRRLGVRYPVALDNDFATWNAFRNRYWPAKYVLDREGRIRYTHFGEGEYGRTEQVIRQLLAENGTEVRGRSATGPAERIPYRLLTPESYLGWARLAGYAGSRIVPDRFATYRFANLPLRPGALSYEGRWRVERERIVAGAGARLRLDFNARRVFLVLATETRGSMGVASQSRQERNVEVFLDGFHRRTVRVGPDRLYELLELDRVRAGLLELHFSPGVAAYAFTFG